MSDLRLGDCLDVMAGLEAESVDTVITDPPYGLTANKNGGTGAASLNLDHPGGRSRITTGGGFMGKKWDAGVPGPEYWAECLRVAKPGAMLCAFGGSRTHHRLMCAIEDAGWEIRDVLMWLYGSGFPKSHDIGKAIDKAAGAKREVVGEWHKPGRGKRSPSQKYGLVNDSGTITSPATDAAALWDGWGTALKPAYEPIILAMKPLPSTFASNALTYGVAGLWVDGCRVGTNGDDPNHRRPGATAWGNSDETKNCYGKGLSGRPTENLSTKGRWPANLLLSHAPGCECVGVRKVKGEGGRNIVAKKQDSSWFVPDSGQWQKYHGPDGTEIIGDWICTAPCPVRLLDEQSGELKGRNGGNTGESAGYNGGWGQVCSSIYRDTGGASRFFTRFHYSAKASRSERELGLLGHIPCLKCGLLDSVTHMNVKTGKEEKCRRNGHPTVKPLDVCRWLCRLTKTPTGGVVLDPFAGSGRISMAAILEGRDTIGIELERPSFEIAQAAVQWAQEQMPEMVQSRFEKEA